MKHITVKYERSFSDRDIRELSPDQLQYIIKGELVNAILDDVKYTKEPQGDRTIVRAQIKYVKE
jgi:hypothetical protein